MSRNTRQDVRVTLVDVGKTPDADGEITYTGGAFRLRDASGTYDPRAAGTGITEGTHEALDSLAHGMAEDAWCEVIRDERGRVASRTWYAADTKELKIREVLVLRSRCLVSAIVTHQSEGAGLLVSTRNQSLPCTNGRISAVDEALS